MMVGQQIGVLALRQVLNGACHVLGITWVAGTVDTVADFLIDRFKDHSRQLIEALEVSIARAWRSLEVALAGESLWGWLAPGDDRALRRQVRAFLDAVPQELLSLERDVFRREALRELRAARRAGLLGGPTDLIGLASRTAELAAFADPAGALRGEWQVVDAAAALLAAEGYVNLAKVLALRPPEGPALLVLAVRYFFRLAVESDPALFQALSWASWEDLAQAQRRGFDDLREALDRRGREVERGLGELEGRLGLLHGAVLDLRDEQARQGDLHQAIYEGVRGVQARLEDLERRLPPELDADTDATERDHIREILRVYRGLPEELRRDMPALLLALGGLQVRTGDGEEARRTFAELDGLLTDREALAESHYHSCRASLDRGDWERALASYAKAADLAPAAWTDERLRLELGEALRHRPRETRIAAEQALARWHAPRGGSATRIQ